MRAALPLLLLLVVPHAGAQAVELVEARPPERTLAERTFTADVTIRNAGAEPRSVVLLAALYARDGTPCGPAGEPSFRQFTHLVQERIPLAAGESRVVEDWANRYRRASVEAAPATMEWCVFVAEDAGERIEYLDFVALPLSVRGENAKPVPSFMWTPATPAAARDVRFSATAVDPDGDPVTFRWDFGHANASGRRPVDGATATHAFYPEGRYVVTLTASDGLEEAAVSREVVVGPAATEDEPGARDVPFGLILPLAAPAWAAWARARRP